ncbi:MAG: hypothetical protein ABI164_09030 [Acidobacteriaceae bacterium]
MSGTSLLRLLPAVLALSVLTLLAQHSAPHFHPGQWQIDSVQTVMGGRQISSQSKLCVKHPVDFWKVAQAGLTCKPPKNHPVADGIRVQVHCVYDKAPLHSEIHSDVIETIGDGGNSFTLNGTTTTNTEYQGVRPTVTSAQLRATAHRVGDCP